MCGRTSLFVPWGVLEDRFDATAVDPLPPRYNVAPGDDLAVIRADAPKEIRRHEWGLRPGWDDDRVINARAETIEDKPTFADAAANRRCLVLADGFYEWQERATGSQPFRVEREDGAPFAMAGLYEPGDGESGEDESDDGRPTATVITTGPNEVVAPLHDRMAAILAPDEEDAWLGADDPDARAGLLEPPDPGPFHAYPVSPAVNDPANDGPELVERADVPEEDPQRGLDDFG